MDECCCDEHASSKVFAGEEDLGWDLHPLDLLGDDGETTSLIANIWSAWRARDEGKVVRLVLFSRTRVPAHFACYLPKIEAAITKTF